MVKRYVDDEDNTQYVDETEKVENISAQRHSVEAGPWR